MDDPKETHEEQEQQNQQLEPPHDETPPRFYNRDATTFWFSTPTYQEVLSSRQPQQPLCLNGSPSSVATTQQRGRGRARGPPPGSGKKHLNALGSSMTPHIIYVNPGEDIATKLGEFMNQEQGEEFCIISASGVVSRALLQSTNLSGPIQYEGRYDITNMSGSFLNTGSNDGTVTRAGNLTVSLAGPDFKVVGGFVAGMFVASSHVRVIVGSFVREKAEPASAQANVLSSGGGGSGGLVSPRSHHGQIRSGESSDENDSNVGTSTTPLRMWPAQ